MNVPPANAIAFVPTAPASLTCKAPLLIVVTPLYELATVRIKAPGPDLVRPPGPVSVPLIVKRVRLSVISTAAPEALRVAPRSVLAEGPRYLHDLPSHPWLATPL